MDKEVLIQYCELMEEIKDIRRRIRELDKFLENPPIVADTVKGSRADLTIGPIKVNGFPDPMLYRKKRAAERYRKLLTAKEAELLELTTKAEEYIEAIKKPDLRIMFRFYYTVRFRESCDVDGSIIAEVKQGKDGASVKLADRMKALEWLAAHMDLATDEQRSRMEHLKAQTDKITGQGQEIEDLDEIEGEIYGK